MSEATDSPAPTCPHCKAGHEPVWQPHSREWVHRSFLASGRGTTQFSITLCVDGALRRVGAVP